MNRNSNQKVMVVAPRKKQQKQDKERFDPPSFLSLPVYFRRLRFRNVMTTDQTVVITAGGICAALGFVPDTVNNRAYCTTSNILVKKIQIWAAPKSDSSDAFKTASIDWHNSTGYCSGKKKSDVSVSNSRPLYVSSKPPNHSVSNFWIESFNTQIVTLTVPPSAIVDLQVSYTMSEGSMDYVSRSNFISSAIAFTYYYGRLDFNSASNNGGVLLPIDLITL